MMTVEVVIDELICIVTANNNSKCCEVIEGQGGGRGGCNVSSMRNMQACGCAWPTVRVEQGRSEPQRNVQRETKRKPVCGSGNVEFGRCEEG